MNHSILANLMHIGPLVILGVLAATICVERFYALYVVYPLKNIEQFFEAIQQKVDENKVSEAITLCDRRAKSPAAQIVRVGLVRINQADEIIENGLGMAISDAQERVQKRTGYLATIANVATLTGLFGTVMGLVQSFEAIGGASAAQRSTLLAAGISTAMNATLLGLGVAIPCLLVYALYANKTNKLNKEIEKSAARTLDLIKIKFFANEVHKMKKAV
jgi:biopolymer transport protein ExbB